MPELRFNGSVWCNLDIAMRSVDEIYSHETRAIGLSVIEWYILRVLYDHDGQMASHLAKAVGRPATSFTPILDQLENKKLIERQTHPSDRRSVKIYLTKQGKELKPQVEAIAEMVETKLSQQFADKEWQSFKQVIANFQTANS